MNKIFKFMDVNILYMSYTCVHVLVAFFVSVYSVVNHGSLVY